LNTEAVSHLFQEDLYHLPPYPLAVILSREWNLYTTADTALLEKILGAVKLDLASVRLITAKELSFAGFSSLATSKVLAFGVTLNEIKSYEHVQAQGFSVIKADDLSALDDAKKKSLWLALRNMFGL
jgi:hypothetical protein